MDNEPYYTIIKNRLCWFQYEPDNQKPYVLDKTDKFILFRVPGFKYAPGMIAEYFSPRYVIGKLLKGSFDDKFTFAEIFEIQYSRKTMKEAKEKSLEFFNNKISEIIFRGQNVIEYK